jgi:hypothetical protein
MEKRRKRRSDAGRRFGVASFERLTAGGRRREETSDRREDSVVPSPRAAPGFSASERPASGSVVVAAR